MLAQLPEAARGCAGAQRPRGRDGPAQSRCGVPCSRAGYRCTPPAGAGGSLGRQVARPAAIPTPRSSGATWSPPVGDAAGRPLRHRSQASPPVPCKRPCRHHGPGLARAPRRCRRHAPGAGAPRLGIGSRPMRCNSPPSGRPTRFRTEWQRLVIAIRSCKGWAAADPVRRGEGKGTFFRVIAGPLATKADAQALCTRLKKAGAFCHPSGS